MTVYIDQKTLRPGLLVSLKTSIHGNVHYLKTEIEAQHETADGAKARWETERTIADPVEHEAAKKARSKAAGLIRRVCKQSAFGLLCPEEDAGRLAEAVRDARVIADEFNKAAQISRLTVYVITGKVSPDDAEAVKAIKSEIRELMEMMEGGVGQADAAAIRDAASRAKELGAMLSEDAAAKVQIAVETARAAATRIVKDGASQASDEAAVRKIASMRTAFLDLDEVGEIAAPKAKAAALDIAPPAKIASVQTADENRLIDEIDGQGWRV